jgi:hypothetical protein
MISTRKATQPYFKNDDRVLIQAGRYLGYTGTVVSWNANPDSYNVLPDGAERVVLLFVNEMDLSEQG